LESKLSIERFAAALNFARNLRAHHCARVREAKFRLLALLECEMTKTVDYLAMLAALAAIGAICVGMR
jgi:hypothetical protein